MCPHARSEGGGGAACPASSGGEAIPPGSQATCFKRELLLSALLFLHLENLKIIQLNKLS